MKLISITLFLISSQVNADIFLSKQFRSPSLKGKIVEGVINTVSKRISLILRYEDLLAPRYRSELKVHFTGSDFQTGLALFSSQKKTVTVTTDGRNVEKINIK